ncbi:hypothetical protein HDV00_010567 [Rhizophlyctis rosea]|nr:hypothetical protein HDV00_010567 [Rhizophlyctis rosea]
MSIAFKQHFHQQQRSASPVPSQGRSAQQQFQQQQQQQRGKNMQRQQKRDNSPHNSQAALNVSLLVKKRNRSGNTNKKLQAVQGDTEQAAETSLTQIPSVTTSSAPQQENQQRNGNSRNQRYPQQQQQQQQLPRQQNQKQQSQLGSLLQTAKEKAGIIGEAEGAGKSGIPGILNVPRGVFQNETTGRKGPNNQKKVNIPPNAVVVRPSQPRQTASAPPALADSTTEGPTPHGDGSIGRRRRQRRKRVAERSDILKEAEAGSSSDEKNEAAPTIIPSVMQNVHIIPLVSPPEDARPSMPRRRLSAPDATMLQAQSEALSRAPDSARSTRTADRLYAGANFQNSPAASNLPIPVFSTRQQTPTSASATNTMSDMLPRSYESTSVPNSFFGMHHHTGFSGFGPTRTPSHEVLRVQLEHSPTPPPRTHDSLNRHQNTAETEMFSMEDDHRDTHPRTTDADLRKKSRELLSLLSGASRSAPTSGDASPLRSSQTSSPVGFADPFADPRAAGEERLGGMQMQKPVAVRGAFGQQQESESPSPPQQHGVLHHHQQHQQQDHNVLAQISQNLKNMLKIN